MSCTFDKLSLSHSLSSSGFLTENSSLFSMTENDFDQLATKKTNELFDAMDGILFDGKHDGNHAIIRECHEWRSAFPHLRVTGAKLLEQQEHGYQRYSPSTKLMNNELTYRHLQGLEVKGEKASKILKSVGSGEEDEADEYGSSINGANYDGDDEVIELQGHYEEVLAIDY
ncbi:hypothetical protein HELRODRAFT_162800 [Helobdella robusta]|uniref:DUF3719 domain-containing protein n=1 Tax=Helobdella robusta TaxID=6412 RepID=T1ET63_HELRO|nr:hypothetical protein HELRODRAFT_162800 [Helobdella robusta]ESN99281.1 hypothetical protein HELRODRAFT_162800 [Helobdella robusta]